MTTLKNFIIILLMVFSAAAYSQVLVECTIENQTVSGTDFFFDLYMKTLSGTSGNLYLDNADFVLTYNDANFTSPTLSKVSNPNPILGFIQNGYNTFTSTTNTDANATATNNNVQKVYYDNTSTSINAANELIINLNGAVPSDQTNFNDKVALINGSTSVHRLGRFKISGISNSDGSANLSWKGSGSGVRTKVFTLATTTPFTSTQIASANLTLTDPSNAFLPVELSSFDAKEREGKVDLTWTTLSEIDTYYFEVHRINSFGDWSKIGQVNAAGNSNQTLAYGFTDETPYTGNNYYRLKIVDFDDTYTYSETQVVKISRDVVAGNISIYPNPVVEEVRVRYYNGASTASIAIYDAKGARVYNSDLISAADEEIVLDVAHLASGMYMLTSTSGDKMNTFKFVKK